MARRTFGSIRQRSGGRFQARYRGPDGLLHTAPITYPTRRDAEAYLATVETDIIRQTWRAPVEQSERLDDYARRVIARRDLKPQTRTAYLSDWSNHVAPTLGRRPMGAITPDEVRTWYADLSASMAARMSTVAWKSTGGRRDGAATVARCYRILRMVFAQAVEDDILDKSPCRIRGGGSYRSPERPILSAQEVERLAEAVPSRYRAMVLVLAWTSMRVGEAAELRWRDVDFVAGTVRVERAVYPVEGEGYVVGSTKSAAGVRTVDLPAFVVRELEAHGPDLRHPDALVFSTRSQRCAYGAAQTAITRALRGALGRTDVRVHDLRHTGEVFAAEEGATVAELMERLGHSTVNAAMTYAHAAKGRSRVLADRLDQRRAAVIDISTGRQVG